MGPRSRSIGENKANTNNVFFIDFRSFYVKFVERIGLKSPGSYSGPFWFYNFSILSLEDPQTSMSMMSGFLRLVGTLINSFYWLVF